jgi:hypothetical protein
MLHAMLDHPVQMKQLLLRDRVVYRRPLSLLVFGLTHIVAVSL